MRKKILFVINTLGRAGAETALITLLKKLPENEYDISLYVLCGHLYGVLDYRHMRFGACQELINLVFIAFAADFEHVVKLFG